MGGGEGDETRRVCGVVAKTIDTEEGGGRDIAVIFRQSMFRVIART